MDASSTVPEFAASRSSAAAEQPIDAADFAGLWSKPDSQGDRVASKASLARRAAAGVHRLGTGASAAEHTLPHTPLQLPAPPPHRRTLDTVVPLLYQRLVESHRVIHEPRLLHLLLLQQPLPLQLLLPPRTAAARRRCRCCGRRCSCRRRHPREVHCLPLGRNLLGAFVVLQHGPKVLHEPPHLLLLRWGHGGLLLVQGRQLLLDLLGCVLVGEGCRGAGVQCQWEAAVHWQW